jgi:hypothetical protein
VLLRNPLHQPSLNEKRPRAGKHPEATSPTGETLAPGVDGAGGRRYRERRHVPRQSLRHPLPGPAWPGFCLPARL